MSGASPLFFGTWIDTDMRESAMARLELTHESLDQVGDGQN